MLHITEFDKIEGEILASYTQSHAPEGRVIGKQGNALLIETDNGVAVVSCPRIQGNIVDLAGINYTPKEIDLSWAF